MKSKLIYLDNAATTFPKPRAVLDAMVETYAGLGVSPGRGGYDLAAEAEELVRTARRKVADFFGAPDPDRVVFTANATDALNIAIQGAVGPGDHVVSTQLEHNSVLRPLHHLEEAGIIQYDLVPFDSAGFVDPGDIAGAIRPNTSLVVVSHASNVLGTIQPMEEIGRVCAEKGVPLLVDTAQSAGLVPVDMTAWQAGAIAFTGHKALRGPSGIGGLVVHPQVNIRSTKFGGTGIDSRSPIHTQTYPHRLEAGTLNLMGIIGLSVGLDVVKAEGLEDVHKRETTLLKRLCAGFSETNRIRIMGKQKGPSVGLATVTVEDMDPHDVAAILDADFGIAVRAGLHCAPLVHKAMGTFPAGGVRFSLGPYTTEEDIERAIGAMEMISKT